MKLVAFGGGGQLARELARRGIRLIGRDRADFERPEMVAEAVRSSGADAIINAAAYTAVDRAESEPDRAWLVNAESVGAMARAAAASGIALVHVSTDYVFGRRLRDPAYLVGLLRPCAELRHDHGPAWSGARRTARRRRSDRRPDACSGPGRCLHLRGNATYGRSFEVRHLSLFRRARRQLGRPCARRDGGRRVRHPGRRYYERRVSHTGRTAPELPPRLQRDPDRLRASATGLARRPPHGPGGTLIIGYHALTKDR